MADSRVAYGLAKKYGIDTSGMSPSEVWEALKEKGVTPENAGKGAYNSRSDIQPLKQANQKSVARRHIDLPKREYAELCSAIRTKFADKIPAKGQMLYGDSYYQFRYDKKQERIVCSLKLAIKDNEKLIDDIMEDF